MRGAAGDGAAQDNLLTKYLQRGGWHTTLKVRAHCLLRQQAVLIAGLITPPRRDWESSVLSVP